ncbi:MAG: helix-turn-helix domain-containing protein [Gaiellales bacterium]
MEDDDRCPISRALSVVGNRSVLLIMREAYYGTTRFDDFAKRVGIAESMAAARLRDLVEAGLLDRRPYQEPGQRTRYEYVLTEAGADLLPVVIGLGRWGEKHLPSDQPTPKHFTHSGCGETVAAELRCAAGHRVTLGELAVDAPHRRATSLPV